MEVLSREQKGKGAYRKCVLKYNNPTNVSWWNTAFLKTPSAKTVNLFPCLALIDPSVATLVFWKQIKPKTERATRKIQVSWNTTS